MLLLGAVLSPAVACLIAYVVYPEFRAWVSGLTHPGAGWVLAAGALGMYVVLAFLLWYFRSQVAVLFSVLGELGKVGYLWLLWKFVVRPARDHFLWRASVGDCEGEVLIEREALSTVRRLGNEGAVVLLSALKQHPGQTKIVLSSTNLLLGNLAKEEGEASDVLSRGFEELRMRGLVREGTDYGGGMARMSLHPLVTRFWAYWIVEALKEELVERGVHDF